MADIVGQVDHLTFVRPASTVVNLGWLLVYLLGLWLLRNVLGGGVLRR